MVRSLFIFAFVFFIFTQGSAFTLDSLRVECNVTDSESGTPVSAEIRYESMPYGSKIGFRKGSQFYFIMDQEEEYVITVRADGYIPSKITINYSEYAGAGQIIEEIKLSPSRTGKIMRLESLNFAQASDEITSDMHEELDHLVEMLENSPSMEIQLEGHTDYIGDAKLNMKLSEDRVKSVREYIVSKGIERSRIEIKAFGGTKPLSREQNAEAHAQNRRVEVRIIAN